MVDLIGKFLFLYALDFDKSNAAERSNNPSVWYNS